MLTTIVVPCFNEAERLDTGAFCRFVEAVPGIRFLFVNDGSTDDTGRVLAGLECADPVHFSVLDLPVNGGKAEAVRRGMLKAAEGGADLFGYWDADLATPLEEIPRFVELLERRPDIELIFGARVKLLGRRIARDAARHYLGRVVATAISWTLGLAIYDTQCGAKVFRATPEVCALFAEPFVSNWVFDVELIARLIRDRRGTDAPAPVEVIYELPLHRWDEVPGSHVKPSDFFVAFGELARIRRRYFAR